MGCNEGTEGGADGRILATCLSVYHQCVIVEDFFICYG